MPWALALFSFVCLFAGSIVALKIYRPAFEGDEPSMSVHVAVSVTTLCLLIAAVTPWHPGGAKLSTIATSMYALILVALTWPGEPNVREQQAIRDAVAKEISEPVVEMEWHSFWRVEVLTGKNGPPNMSNSGHVVFVIRTWRGWRVRLPIGRWVS